MKIKRAKDRVVLGKPRRRCWLFDELRSAALYGTGSPMRGYVPRECKAEPAKRRG